MDANLGFYLLLLSLILSGYGMLAALAGLAVRHRGLYVSSKRALHLLSFFICWAAIILVLRFLQHDYSLAYVQENSSNDLPLFYTVTAFWASLAGSHLLWTMFAGVIASFSMWFHSRENAHFTPYLLMVYHGVLGWMLYIALFHSDAFRLADFPTADGRGLNELLQNPFMASHPPTLFFAYALFIVPFAYGLAALAYGDITEGWLRSVRRWNLLAWAFLTLSIALGGRWAYVELGWGGYWAWDPVENASFLPWLVSTALIHGLILQERLGYLKRLSLTLTAAAFFLTFLGTFLTRSGVISSVHSFGASSIGPQYLAWLGIIAVVALLLYVLRAPSIVPTEAGQGWGVSRESMLAICLFLFLAFAVIVLLGTIFPILTDIVNRGERISVQAPYFNSFAPYIGFAILITLAVAILLRFGDNNIKLLAGRSLIALLPATLLTSIFIYKGEVLSSASKAALIYQLAGIFLSTWCFTTLIMELFFQLRASQASLRRFLAQNRSYVGALIAHIGLIIMILGLLGNYRKEEKTLTLSVGDTAHLMGYDFTLSNKIEMVRHKNAMLYIAPLKVERNGQFVISLKPAHSVYPTNQDKVFNEISIASGLWKDIYVYLVDWNRETAQTVTLQVHINHTVGFVWMAVGLMILGAIFSLVDFKRGGVIHDD